MGGSASDLSPLLTCCQARARAPNPKYRNPKQKNKSEIRNEKRGRFSTFGFRICFGFRYWAFGFPVGSSREDTRGVPRSVGAAGDVVAVVAMRPRHRAPVSRRAPPGIEAGECGFEDVFGAENQAPRFGDNLRRIVEPADLILQPGQHGSAICMVLPLTGGLAQAMRLRVLEKRRMDLAQDALRPLGMDA